MKLYRTKDLFSKKNIPNVITFIRIAGIPFLIFLLFFSGRIEFLVLGFVLFFTDILDGFLARRLNATSDLGRNLDSYADWLFIPVWLIGVSWYLGNILLPYAPYFFGIALSMIIPKLFALYRLGRVPSLHLRSNKIIAFLGNFYTGIALWLNTIHLPVVALLCLGTIVMAMEEMFIFSLMKNSKDETVTSLDNLLQRRKIARGDWVRNTSHSLLKTLPNLLTITRLLFGAPMLIYFLFALDRTGFMWAGLFFAVTDVLDGNIARMFNAMSEWGRKMDSIADWIFSPFWYGGTIYFLWDQLVPFFSYFAIMAGVKIFPKIISLIRVKRIVFVHLYSNQLYVFIGTFLTFLTLYLGKVHPLIIPIMTACMAVLSIEEVLVCALVKDGDNEEVRSLYGLLQDRSK